MKPLSPVDILPNIPAPAAVPLGVLADVVDLKLVVSALIDATIY